MGFLLEITYTDKKKSYRHFREHEAGKLVEEYDRLARFRNIDDMRAWRSTRLAQIRKLAEEVDHDV